jgi:uroporphyrinogen-III synthase
MASIKFICAKLSVMVANSATAALQGSYVLSLRPVAQHAPLRRAAAAHGARVLALSPWTLRTCDDRATRAALRVALASQRLLFTSPAAVRAAQALQGLHARKGQAWFAVGAGTAAALRRAGIRGVIAPTRMDSEGLLALPGLQEVRGCTLGLVTAAGGRGVIAPTLQQRGATVLRADVYARVAIAPSPRAVAALRALQAPAWLMLSSGGALEQLLDTLPADVLAVLRRAHVVAASERLAQLARTHGFGRITLAASALPRDLVDSAARAALA